MSNESPESRVPSPESEKLGTRHSALSPSCGWCHHRTAEMMWKEMPLCTGCRLDLTVDEYLLAWSTDPAVARSLTYKGVPLAATLEYDLLQELIAVFSKLVPISSPPPREATRG